MSDNFDSDAYATLLERVYMAYEKSLDLDIALTVINIDEETKTRLLEDKDLQARILLCDAKVREELMDDFRYLAKNAASDAVRLTALKELGRTLYPRRFKDNESSGTINIKPIKYEVVEPLK